MHHTFEYRAVQLSAGKLLSQLDMLNKQGEDGWLLVQIIENTNEVITPGAALLAIFVRDKR